MTASWPIKKVSVRKLRGNWILDFLKDYQIKLKAPKLDLCTTIFVFSVISEQYWGCSIKRWQKPHLTLWLLPLTIAAVAAVVLVHQLHLLLLTVPDKVVLQQESGALLALANPLHLRWHQFVPRGEILRVEKLVNLYSPPLPVGQFSSPSPPSLYQRSRLVVWTQEYDHVNSIKVDTKEHLVTSQIERNLCSSSGHHLLCWRE